MKRNDKTLLERVGIAAAYVVVVFDVLKYTVDRFTALQHDLVKGNMSLQDYYPGFGNTPASSGAPLSPQEHQVNDVSADRANVSGERY